MTVGQYLDRAREQQEAQERERQALNRICRDRSLKERAAYDYAEFDWGKHERVEEEGEQFGDEAQEQRIDDLIWEADHERE